MAVILVKDVWTFEDSKNTVFRNGCYKVGIADAQDF
jgi:hypothetical protein